MTTTEDPSSDRPRWNNQAPTTLGGAVLLVREVRLLVPMLIAAMLTLWDYFGH